MTTVALQQSSGAYYPAREESNPAGAPSSSTRSTMQQQHQQRRTSASGSFATSRVARDGQATAAIMANGTSPAMPSHHHHASPNGVQQPHASALVNGSDGYHANGTTIDDDAAERRPFTAPGNKHQLTIRTSSFDESDRDQPTRRPKPPLLRSKSEHMMRNFDDSDQTDEELHDWSARHGFEDHYQSEDIISHLANVSCIILFFYIAIFCCFGRP